MWWMNELAELMKPRNVLKFVAVLVLLGAAIGGAIVYALTVNSTR